MRRPGLLSLALLLALLAGACAEGRTQPAPGAGTDDDARVQAHDAHGESHEHDATEHHLHVGHEHDAHDHAHEVPAGELTSGSIYHLTGEWWDATGDEQPLSRLAGRPQLVAMIYTNCAHTCPMILAEMKRIEAALGDDADGIRFALASMDTERDTPEQLAAFAARARLDASRWTLLGAPEGDVLELAAVLGVQFRRLPDGEFTHSVVLAVLDENGEIVHRQLGLGEGTERTVAALRALAD